MTDTMAEALLAPLKIDLGISASAFDSRLLARIKTAAQRIGEAGITLNDSEADQDLVLMYAAWLWSSRTTGAPMPRMLQYTLHSRLFGEKAR